MSDLAARISALPAGRLKMLTRRLADGRPRPDAICREPGLRRHYPLSFSQERLWFLCQLSPTSTAYNNPIPTRIDTSSPLDISVLERCFTEVVRRHEALRTTFALADGQPVQIIQPPFPVRIAFEDLRDLPPPDRDREGLRIATEEGRHPLDLVTGPLVRVTVLRTGECSYLLLLTPHHLISDGWSNGILIRELTSLYQAFSLGLPSPLPEPAVRYVDYALWQRERLSGEHLTKLMTYWTSQLGGQLPVLALPTDHARPIRHDPPGEIMTRFVPPESTRRLRALASSRQATLFETLLSAFYVLLHRYTRQTDLIVGTPVANRTRQEMENIVGLFLNTLCLRVDLGDNPRFVDLIKRVQKVAREAFEHQELPFERLVQALSTRRNLYHSPLFQVMFILQNAHLQPEQKDVVIKPLKLSYGAAQFDLTLHVEEQDGGLRFAAEFRSDLFPAAFIEEMLACYERLLIGVLDAPDQPIEKYALLTAKPWRGLPHAIMVGIAPADELFLSLIAPRVAETPDAIAVRCGSLELTYRQLDFRANQLGQNLRTLGADAETPVPVLAGGSTEMVVAVLGILRAGAHFVPIDAAWPVERIDFILKDSAARLLVASSRLPAGLAFQGEIICPDWSDALPEGSADEETRFVQIAAPIPHTRFHVLDTLLRAVPRSVVGELFIGGPGLALSYQHDPHLTAASFVSDPFSPIASARMYSTGDLARWRADGTLEFCGRADDRAKNRGHPVEPLQVAGTLERHPDAAPVPRDAVEQRLASIWEELLDIRPIAITDDFFELGGHSLLAVRLIGRIEAAFGQSLPLALLFEEGTIERLAIRLRERQTGFPTAPLVPIQTAGSGPTIFFVHPAGGNVLCYYPLGRALAGAYRFQAFQMPPDCQDELALEEMATRYVRALLVEQARGPYLLGGWSLGATVAHEMARQLEQLGNRVGLVAILDQPAPAPSAPTLPDIDEDARELTNLANMAAAYASKASEIRYETLKIMTLAERRRKLWEAFMKAGLVAPDTELASFSMYLEVYRKQMRSLRNYSGGTIKSRTVLFRTAEPLATDILQADGTTDLRPDMGWADRTSGRFAMELVPGTHQTMVAPPHVEMLAAKLAAHVSEALGASPTAHV